MGADLGRCGASIGLEVKVGTEHKKAGQREMRIELKRKLIYLFLRLTGLVLWMG